MTALTPAPLELAHLAATTAGVDEHRLTGWLQGHLAAGVPWPALLKLVDLWLLSGGTELHELDTALRGWRLQHPTRQGAR
jgi:hypothetical protein